MIEWQNLFDVSRFRLVRSFSSEEALDLEFTEKTLHYLLHERLVDVVSPFTEPAIRLIAPHIHL
jgi:hypothetical protein